MSRQAKASGQVEEPSKQDLECKRLTQLAFENGVRDVSRQSLGTHRVRAQLRWLHSSVRAAGACQDAAGDLKRAAPDQR
jgi:hypothetical protein